MKGFWIVALILVCFTGCAQQVLPQIWGHLGEIKDILLILALVCAPFVTLFVYLKFAPVIKISIDSKRVNDTTVLLIIQIENSSKVRVAIKKDLSNKTGSNILLQSFQHNRDEINKLTEFLPFSKEWFEKKNYPGEWGDPEIIFETTEWIYPGEVIAIERPVFHNQSKVLHVGVQVHARFGLFELAPVRHLTQRWTCVRFLV